MKRKHQGWFVVILVALGAAFAPVFAYGEGNDHNGLSSGAFLRNSLTLNPRALKVLLAQALGEVVSDDYVRLQLHDPAARAMMAEIIQCALPKSVAISYSDLYDNQTLYTWPGKLGLCENSKPLANDWNRERPSWGGGGPNLSCQQLVTACVMARVNALGQSVPISLRGQKGVLPRLNDAITTDTIFRETLPPQVLADPAAGTPIGSFSTRCLPGPECDWAPAHVGTCKPGVKLTFTAPPLTHLRVCTGIQGCNGNNADNRVYAKLILPNAPLTYKCPENGYYSVMTYHIVPQPKISAVDTANKGKYPTSEQEVFSFREGAFYGNMFEPAQLKRNCEVPDSDKDHRYCQRTNTGPAVSCRLTDTTCGKTEIPYQHVYACYSFDPSVNGGDGVQDGVQYGVQYLNARICDLQSSGTACFPNAPTPCKAVTLSGVYQDCQGQGGEATGYPPITTYLNDPCDLIAKDSALCGRIRRVMPAFPAPVAASPLVSPMPHVGPTPPSPRP